MMRIGGKVVHNSNRNRTLDEAKDAIINAYESGGTITTIAEQYNVHSTTIWQRLKEWRVEIRRPTGHYNQTLTAAKDAIINEYESGDSVRSIAKRYGVSRTTIWNRLKEWEIEIRDRSGRYKQRQK